MSRSRENSATTLSASATKNGNRQPQARNSAELSVCEKTMNSPLASMKPRAAPSWGIIAYQDRLSGGALSASSETSPSQAPPRPSPCPIRNRASSSGARTPRVAYPGRKLIAMVEPQSRNSATMSLAARPYCRSMAMKISEPTGRATKASENTAKDCIVAVTGSESGKKSFGKTRTEAMP